MVDPVGLWSDTSSNAKELFETRYPWTSLSVGRIPGTGRWIVLYQKTLGDRGPEWPFDKSGAGPYPEKRHDGIYARITTTNKPWDWGPEVTIFDPDREKAWGAYMNDEIGGFAYGAYLLNPYTNWDAANETVTIHYLMSTGSPYGIVLMRSQIKINR
jgi:hypothetical protein